MPTKTPAATSSEAPGTRMAGSESAGSKISRPTTGAGAPQTSLEKEVNGIESALIALDFGIQKSLRYHAKRRAFFDFLHNSTMITAAVIATAAFVALLGDNTLIAKIATIIVAIATAFDAIISYSRCARRHDELYRRFSDLAVSIAKTQTPTEQRIRQWKSDRLLIEKDEPTQISALNVRCHNEEAEARGYRRHRLLRHQVLFCYLFTMPPNKFPELPD